jgi:hypothetical protein
MGGSGGRSPPREKGDDADADDADAPRPNPPQLGPQAHPVQEKISRSGEPLTLIYCKIRGLGQKTRKTDLLPYMAVGGIWYGAKYS